MGNVSFDARRGRIRARVINPGRESAWEIPFGPEGRKGQPGTQTRNVHTPSVACGEGHAIRVPCPESDQKARRRSTQPQGTQAVGQST
ncbi:hypothetical protein PAPYR_8 [Paratrimastix pyriformis]|uniref:Uncharacterized protein n=1 Tax=Paratrimastix pyriformis TaxID=342808 RepID=A0ABQ8UUM1_9EUKA|nr:hypothetical protein PAPYR_8 [Paratrimastix pyriformis]